MNNIINFQDYSKKTNKVVLEKKEEYLDRVKSILDQNDYEEVLCGIVDIEYYNLLELDLKTIVDNYYRIKIRKGK